MAIDSSMVHANTESDHDGNESPHRLNERQVERGTIVLLFLGSLAYLWLFRRFTTLEPDEGIVLQGASRVLSGQVPYKDFFSFYTPGSFYLVAVLFRVFGNSFVVARGSLAFAGAICSVITYLVARRVCSRGIALFAAILATIAGFAFRFLVLHNSYSTLLACVGVYCVVRVAETGGHRWAFAAGTLTALTFLVEQPKGGGLALGIGLGVLLLCRAGLLNRSILWPILGGVSWPFLVVLAYFSSKHALHEMISSWLWPLQHYTTANRVPYGWQNWSDQSREMIFRTGPWFVRVAKAIAVSPGLLVSILPLAAIALLLYWIPQLRRQDAPISGAPYYVMVCSTLSGLLVSVIIVRTDILHFMYLAPLWYIVLAWIMGAPSQSKVLQRVRPIFIFYVATAFGMLGLAVLLVTTGSRNQMDTRRGVIKTGTPDTVIPFLQSHSKAGDKILVYPYLPLYNYLSATTSPSRFEFFQPGMDTPEQSREILASIESTQVKAVLIEPGFPEKFANSWPGTPLQFVVRDPIADYVNSNFRVCKMLNSPEGWRFHYMVRRDSSCPEPN